MGRFNKKGSSAVFLTMILITMIGAALTFSQAAKAAACASEADGIMRLAGRSVLAEYDRHLKEQYGVFAFCGMEDSIKEKLGYYLENNLCSMEYTEPECNAAEYSLENIDIFGEAVKEAGKFIVLSGLSDELDDILSDEQKLSEDKADDGAEDEHPERTLRNSIEINSLPSKGAGGSGISISLIGEKGFSLIEKGSDLWYTNRYIMANFRCAVGNEVDKETFFKNETEYILFGKYSDEENRNAFHAAFVALRTALNSTHIYANAEKRQETMALAEVLTPGPEALVTQAALIAAWAAAEAVNDWRLLEEGRNVAFFKTDVTWAVELEAAIENIGTGKAIIPVSDKGRDYKEYLTLFLSVMKKETKLLRMMDLIQLNMRGAYYEDFLIKDHITGFDFTVTVNGKKYAYEQKY